MEEIKMETTRKSFTIHIHGSAEYVDDMKGIIDFDQLVNIYFRNNRNKLKEIFDSMEYVMDNSALRDFQFDGVTKDVQASQ